MKINDGTKKALNGLVDGKTYHSAMTPLTRRMIQVLLNFEEHRDEIEALSAANEGDCEPLAALVEGGVQLRFPDVRSFVAARVRGDKRTRKPKQENVVRRVRFFLRILDDMNKAGISQSTALERYIDQENDFVIKAFGIMDECGIQPSDEQKQFLDIIYQESVNSASSNFKRGRDEFRVILEDLGFQVGSAFPTKQSGKRQK